MKAKAVYPIFQQLLIKEDTLEIPKRELLTNPISRNCAGLTVDV